MTVAVLALALGVSSLSACSGSRSEPTVPSTDAAASDLDTCTPTAPNGHTPPGEALSENYLGNGELFTVLWPDGVVVFEPGGPGEVRDDGRLAMKWPFVRGEGVVGTLTIDGTSLHRPGQRVSAEIPEGYGTTGFQAAALVFPEPGCYEITARAGDAHLTFVTIVESEY